MFILTPDQQYILSILSATNVMRKDQAVKLLGKLDSTITNVYALRCLDQLRHIRKIVWKTESVFTPPMLYSFPVDGDMLSAVDIMLDLTSQKVSSISAGPSPYKLCFLSEEVNNLRAFAVTIVKPGSECMINASLPGANNSRTVILLITDRSQKNSIETSLPHYYAIRDSDRYRYFEPG